MKYQEYSNRMSKHSSVMREKSWQIMHRKMSLIYIHTCIMLRKLSMIIDFFFFFGETHKN